MKCTKIVGGKVFTPECRFEEKTVYIKDGLFWQEDGHSASLSCAGAGAGETVLDAAGCYVIPGLIDIHFHGCMGYDLCDGTAEAMHAIAAFEAKEGVTAICPAALTLPVEELKRILSCAADFARLPRRADEADLIGINMEGPFICPVRKGAQNGIFIIPFDADLCRRFFAASEGLVKIIGIAPEENPGFEEEIQTVKEKVRVSLAHTNADYDTAMAAFAAGASHAVHLYNGMPEMTHREPGVVGAVRDASHVTAELICDGNHIHPSVIRAAFDMLSGERIVLISDSLRAAGLGDGRVMLGGQAVDVKGTRATLAEGGNLAGSVVNLLDCLRIVVRKMHIPLETAVRCAAWNPARVIGAENEYGCIAPGRRANVVLLDRTDLSLKTVVKDGTVIFRES